MEPSIKPELTVGTDPADVPGLIAPRPTEAGPEDAVSEEPFASDEEPDPDADPDADLDAGESEDEEAESSPLFEVSDRRGSISADRTGIHFRLDDQEAEFPWSEIGAVEIRLPRLGRRFTVEVHLLTRRWFNADVEAKARSDLKKWEAELDAVLVAHLEDT